MAPIAFNNIVQRAAGLLARDDASSSTTGNRTAVIVVAIFLTLAAIISTALVALCLVRRRRNQAASRDSFVPNNFKIVSHFSTILDSSRRTSRVNSVYKPTNEYGQYRAPPLPQQAVHHSRSLSHSNVLRNGSAV